MSRVEADGVQADVVGARGAAGGEEDLVGLDAVAAVGDGHDGAVLPGHRPDRGAGADVDAGLGERLGDQFAGERLHAVEQALAAHEEGDPGAEGLPGRGHLGGDHSPADDDQPARRGLGAGGLAAGPGLDRVESGQAGQHGAGAGADGDGVPGGEDLVAHRHGARAGQAAVAAVEVGPDAVEPPDLAVVLPVGGVLVTAGEDRGGVEGALYGRGEAGQPTGVGLGDDRAQQGLAGHTRPVRTFAADQFALHDRGGEAGRARAVGDVLPHGPGSEHYDVIHSGFRFRHRGQSAGWCALGPHGYARGIRTRRAVFVRMARPRHQEEGCTP